MATSHELFFKTISLVEKQLTRLKAKTGFDLKGSQPDWLSCVRDLLLVVSGQLMISLTSLNTLVIGMKCLPSLLNILQLVKELFGVPGQDFNLSERASVMHSEGVDFSTEFNFETSHPYTRGDVLQRETVSNSRAIGFVIEFDKRCSAEN